MSPGRDSSEWTEQSQTDVPNNAETSDSLDTVIVSELSPAGSPRPRPGLPPPKHHTSPDLRQPDVEPATVPRTGWSQSDPTAGRPRASRRQPIVTWLQESVKAMAKTVRVFDLYAIKFYIYMYAQ